ncbi:conserved hypothetical protein [Candidatus Caldarchaeum subterraneum]|uniref:Protein associated with acetyl-CoA C-acyltransferase n=2 Tax=Thermoproteati TaxID=1783275 RepID=H5SNS6_9CREN|nr:conserved hypothetical protein [Candidatus Caldarchaeum subterraneum]BAJ48451.1 conserved hypothetical protein [Candidatus Caldarchaeum subterraneum]BAJ51202.1 conserved hypothetical protein [Candidatus Caldarchaeum subterraneum]BAL57812.1 protein associated with acetyl-CoA C-acyltransferase [uncultured crenarchaeote]
MEIESYYEYPAGVALSKFLEGLHNGKIIASRCGKCSSKHVPPRAYCLDCFKPINEYIEVDPAAVVQTYTRSRMLADGEAGEEIVWVFVRFVDTLGGLLHMLDPSKTPRTGMKVKPVFREKRVGSIHDIKWFTAAD